MPSHERNLARPSAALATKSPRRLHSPVRANAHRSPARRIRLAVVSRSQSKARRANDS
jgi:hypothetical protein